MMRTKYLLRCIRWSRSWSSCAAQGLRPLCPNCAAIPSKTNTGRCNYLKKLPLQSRKKIVPALPLGADELQSAQQNFARYQQRCDKPEDSQRIRAIERSEFGKLAPLSACLRRFYPASKMAIEFFCIGPTQNQKPCPKSTECTESPQPLENAHAEISAEIAPKMAPKIAQAPQNAQAGQSAQLVQINLYWEISHWKREDALLLPLFLDLLAELGLAGQPYEKTARQKSLQIGSWDAEIIWKPQFKKPFGKPLGKPCSSQTVRSFAHIQLSFLPREWRGGLALFWELLGTGEWQNEAKLLELLQSRYYEKSAELRSSPLNYAVQRSCYRLFASRSKEAAAKTAKQQPGRTRRMVLRAGATGAALQTVCAAKKISRAAHFELNCFAQAFALRCAAQLRPRCAECHVE